MEVHTIAREVSVREFKEVFRMLNKAIAAIEQQQAAVKPRSPQWMVGEQLKDICRREPKSAELIAQDLAVKEMSITEAEKKIKAFADKHKTGNFACVTPIEAEKILREFYGLPDPFEDGGTPERGEESQETDNRKSERRKVLDLADFL